MIYEDSFLVQRIGSLGATVCKLESIVSNNQTRTFSIIYLDSSATSSETVAYEYYRINEEVLELENIRTCPGDFTEEGFRWKDYQDKNPKRNVSYDDLGKGLKVIFNVYGQVKEYHKKSTKIKEKEHYQRFINDLIDAGKALRGKVEQFKHS